MKAPNADNAVVPPEKLRDYLLSPFHPVGRSKAKFFIELGYRPNEWSVLGRDLHALLLKGEATKSIMTAYGQKYEICGAIKGPSGRSADVVTVWIIRHGESIPRFVTAYPGGKK
jgi:hypothetical protein